MNRTRVMVWVCVAILHMAMSISAHAQYLVRREVYEERPTVLAEEVDLLVAICKLDAMEEEVARDLFDAHISECSSLFNELHVLREQMDELAQKIYARWEELSDLHGEDSDFWYTDETDSQIEQMNVEMGTLEQRKTVRGEMLMPEWERQQTLFWTDMKDLVGHERSDAWLEFDGTRRMHDVQSRLLVHYEGSPASLAFVDLRAIVQEIELSDVSNALVAPMVTAWVLDVNNAFARLDAFEEGLAERAMPIADPVDVSAIESLMREAYRLVRAAETTTAKHGRMIRDALSGAERKRFEAALEKAEYQDVFEYFSWGESTREYFDCLFTSKEVNVSAEMRRKIEGAIEATLADMERMCERALSAAKSTKGGVTEEAAMEAAEWLEYGDFSGIFNFNAARRDAISNISYEDMTNHFEFMEGAFSEEALESVYECYYERLEAARQ